MAQKTKTCPDCGTNAPLSAARCKSCFHDYAGAPSTSWAPIALLGTAVVMVFLMGLTFFALSRAPRGRAVLVDADTQQIQITTEFLNGPTADKISFSRVAKLEHVSEGGRYEIIAVLDDGRRESLGRAIEPLYATAESYANIMQKPLDRTGSDERRKEAAPPSGG